MKSTGVDASRSSETATSDGDGQDIHEPAPTTMQMAAAESRNVPPRPVGDAAVPAPPEIPLAPLKRLQARFNPLADGMMYLAVFVGGFAGAAFRSPLTALFPAQVGAPNTATVPYVGTLAANALACFVYALVTSYLSRASWVAKRLRQLIGSGVGLGLCGTFSVMAMLMLQGFMLLQAGRFVTFLGYMLSSFGLGIVAAIMGNQCGRMVAAKRQAAAVRHSHESASSFAVQTAQGGHRGEVTPEVSGQPDQPDQPGRGDNRTAQSPVQAPLAYEPPPITDEIPMVPNPTTGEVH